MSDQTQQNKPDTGRDQPPEHLIVGQVVAPFGVQGEIKATIMTEFPERFQRMKRIILAPYGSIEQGLAPTASLNPGTVRGFSGAAAPSASEWRPPREATTYKVQGVRFHKGHLLIRLEGIDTPEKVEALRGFWLLVPREHAHRLPAGAFYIYQVVGIPVYTEAGALVGTVQDVLVAAANDVYVVKGEGVKGAGGELLVPAIKTVVKEIDVEGRRMVIADPADWS